LSTNLIGHAVSLLDIQIVDSSILKVVLRRSAFLKIRSLTG
jgi:hypothetical protein